MDEITFTTLSTRPRYGGLRLCRDCRIQRRSRKRSRTWSCHLSGQPESAVRSCSHLELAFLRTTCKIYMLQCDLQNIYMLQCPNVDLGARAFIIPPPHKSKFLWFVLSIIFYWKSDSLFQRII